MKKAKPPKKPNVAQPSRAEIKKTIEAIRMLRQEPSPLAAMALRAVDPVAFDNFRNPQFQHSLEMWEQDLQGMLGKSAVRSRKRAK